MRHKELREEIEKIAKMYFLALSKSKEKKISDSKRSLNEYEKFIYRVRRAFSTLNNIEQEFINNDFFYQAYDDWWTERYSRASYYRMKTKSMIRFKEAFDNEP